MHDSIEYSNIRCFVLKRKENGIEFIGENLKHGDLWKFSAVNDTSGL